MKLRFRNLIVTATVMGASPIWASVAVTNGAMGTTSTNAATVNGGGWFESSTANWVEGSWANSGTYPATFPSAQGMACLFDGAAANGYIYQKIGTLDATDIAQGAIRITSDFAEKSDDTTVNGKFDVYAGPFTGANGTDIASGGLTNIFSLTMDATAQGLTAASGNNSRQTARLVGDVNISGLAAGTDIWLRIGRPSSGAGDFIIDNVAATVTTVVWPKLWDTNGSVAGAGGATPAGTWDSGTPNWTANTAGSGATAGWTAGDGAVFAAGSDATGAYTVTVTGTQQARSLATEEGTVTLTGGRIDLVSPATVSAAAGSQLRIESILGGTEGVSTSDAGTTTLAGTNIYTGATSLGGKVNLDGGSAIPDTGAVTGVSGATVTLLANETIGDLSGSGTFALGGKTLTLGTATATTTFSGTLSGTGTLIKQGSGILSLNSTSSAYTGAVTINNGTLRAGMGNSASGTLPKASSITINNGGVLTTADSNSLFGWDANAVPITVNTGGTLALAVGGTNVYGTITLAGGTVGESNIHGTYGSYNYGAASLIATGSADSTLSARDFQLRNSATTVQVDAGSTLNVTGYFTGLTHSGGKTLNKTGDGKLILASATASSHGATNVNAGELELTGVHGTGTLIVASGATLSGNGTANGAVNVGTGATLTMANNAIGELNLKSSASLLGTTVLEISKDATGAQFADLVFGMTAATFGGKLTVTNITTDTDPAAQLAVGDTFTLFDAASFSGGFASFELPALPDGMSWDKSRLTIDGTITIINKVAPVVFTPPGGGYAGAQTITLSSDPGSTIYYTIDGTPANYGSPSAASPVTGIVVPADSSMSISAFAVKNGMGDSDLGSASYVTVTTPTWTEVLGGTWDGAETFNWLSGVVGNGPNVTADFGTLTLEGDTTVTNTTARSIGHMRFGDLGDTYNWMLSGSEITLAGTTPSITVDDSTTTITAPLAGLSGLRKLGDGTLRLQNNESYAGNTTVDAGTLVPAAGSAAYGISTLQGTLTVNSGATCAPATANAFGWGGGLTDIYLNGGTLAGFSPVAYGISYHLQGGMIASSGNIRMGVMTGSPNPVITSAASAITSEISAGITQDGTFGASPTQVTVAQGTTPDGVDLRISGAIAGVYGMTKTGAGNLVLTANNTYSGATTVNEGTLTVDGATGSGSAINVNANSTLAGAGNAAGAVAVASTAFVAPGGAAIGTLRAGPANIEGTYSCQINGVTADSLTVTGSLTFGAGATLAITTLGDGATEPFYTIASYTGTLTGTPLVTGMPAGYSLSLAAPNEIRILKSSSYAGWSADNAGGQAINLDFDGDGVSNGIEYFMGETGFGATALPVPDSGRVITWTKDPSYTGDYGTDYRIEISADLGRSDPWTAVPLGNVTIGSGSISYDLDTAPAGPRKFARLVVTGP
ncbi:MAG: autotransporter-associated beta strand repeat-containing protein [Verrucomicrobia bacterium]|nr:autotransporter-associated beta strand repeat-containing protein [Verrucomicrobiota bacterium]